MRNKISSLIEYKIQAFKLFSSAVYCTFTGLKFQKTVVFLTLLRFFADEPLYVEPYYLRLSTTIIETERL